MIRSPGNCGCAHGQNEGLSYDCQKPCEDGYKFAEFFCDCYRDEPVCPEGVAIEVRSHISLLEKVGVEKLAHQESTFLFALAPPGAPARVIAESEWIEVFMGDEWVPVGMAPFLDGQEYEGSVIGDVYHVVTVSPNCNGHPHE